MSLGALGNDEIISASRDGQVLRWNLKTGESAPFSGSASPPLSKLASEATGELAVAITPEKQILPLRAADKELPAPEKLSSFATSVSVGNSRHYAAGCEDGSLSLWLWNGARHV